MVAGKDVARRHQRKNDCQARTPDRRSRQEKSANSWAGGTFLWALFLRRTANALVRADRASSEWPNDLAHAEAGEKTPNGDGGADLRSRNAGRLLQHRGGNRRGRSLPGKISQAPYSALPSRLLGKVLFHSGQRWLSCFRNTLRSSRRLHLLRPPFSRGRAHSRTERRRNCLQSVRYGRWSLRIFVGTRAARARGRERLFCCRHQSCGYREALGNRRVLRQELFLQSAR